MHRKSLIIVLGLVALLQTGFKVVDKWFLLQTKNYQLSFPGKPNKDTRTISSDTEDLMITAYIFQKTNAKDQNTLYGLAERNYPVGFSGSLNNKSLDSFFNRSIEGAVSGIKGKLISEEKISNNGFPGRKIRVNYGNGMLIVNMRFFLAKDVYYSLHTITQASDTSNNTVQQFMNSFKLKK